MKRLFGLLFLAACVAIFASPAPAFYTYFGYKYIPITITVTPSPVTYRFDPSRGIARQSLVGVQVAYDPFMQADVISANQGSVPTTFSVIADPQYNNYHIIIHNTTFNAGYGMNTYTCNYEIYAYFTKAWQITDWVYGTTNTNGGGTPGITGWPTYNYSATSQLSWLAEGITSTFKPFSNSGAPGELAFSGTAGTNKQICIDLQLNVDPSIPAGTYQTTIEYTARQSL